MRLRVPTHYRKTGQRGIFGYCFNTYEPYAGTLWPEPEEVAYEHAPLGVHEPHEEAPEQDVELGRITWWGLCGRMFRFGAPARWVASLPRVGI